MVYTKKQIIERLNKVKQNATKITDWMYSYYFSSWLNIVIINWFSDWHNIFQIMDLKIWIYSPELRMTIVAWEISNCHLISNDLCVDFEHYKNSFLNKLFNEEI